MSEEVEERGRGRPPGVKNGEGEPSTAISNWTTKHDMVVLMHLGMKSNIEIADELDYTPTRVSQILNDPQAKVMIAEHQARMKAKLFGEVEDGLEVLCVRALEIVRETLELQGLAIGSDFKKHQDGMAMDLLKGRGFLGKNSGGADPNQGKIPETLANRIAEALEKSLEAQKEAEKSHEIVVEEKKPVRNGKFELVST